MDKSEICDTLNSVIETMRDGEEFYNEAKQMVDRPDLKGMFDHLAGVRASAVETLSGKVEAYGGKAASGGSAAGNLRRLFDKAKAMLSSDDTASLISSLEEAEDRALEELRTAVGQDLPAADKQVLQGYLGEIQKSHDRMRKLELQVQ